MAETSSSPDSSEPASPLNSPSPKTVSRADLRVNYEGLPFEGKVIAITGGATGIGFAIAKYLAYRGAKVSLMDWRPLEDAANLICATLPQTCCRGRPDIIVDTYLGDVGDSAAVKKWVAHLKEKHENIDGLVNNAGICKPHTIEESDGDRFYETIDTNVQGALNCTREMVPILRDGSSIVNVSSMLGQHGAFGLANYSIASHGVEALTKCAAKEYAGRGIRVNTVAPGFIKTRMLDKMKAGVNRVLKMTDKWDEGKIPVMLRKYGAPDDVAAAVAFLLGDGSKYITSTEIHVDGGWQAN